MAEEIVSTAEDQEVVVTSKAMIALTKKSGGNKILVESMEGYTKGYNVDGIYVTDGTNAVIMSLDEVETTYGGTSEDLVEGDPLYDLPSPSMSTFDGEWRTNFLIKFFKLTEGAAVEAKAYGWLPSGGEISLIASLKDSVNTLLEAVGGTQLSDGAYCTSQKYSNERMWSCFIGENKFNVNYGSASTLPMRAVKSAEGYAEV